MAKKLAGSHVVDKNSFRSGTCPTTPLFTIHMRDCWRSCKHNAFEDWAALAQDDAWLKCCDHDITGTLSFLKRTLC